MEASGLIEFASHSYDLHRGVRANPQGNFSSAAKTWQYDPVTRTYEDDAQYLARIRADLIHSRTLMETNLGHPPRTLAWPYGRYTGPALQVAKELGFTIALTLADEPAYTSDLHAIRSARPGMLARNAGACLRPAFPAPSDVGERHNAAKARRESVARQRRYVCFSNCT
jgi:peptidoglycan/xylan/chitin deacetylase (PgdA/CDA1 family)